MATRIYLPGHQHWAAPLNAAVDSAWDDASPDAPDAPWVICTHLPNPGVDYYSVAGGVDNTVATAGPINCILRSFITAPLVGNQTITGDVKGQMECRENNASANAMTQIVIRVLSPDYQTVRGTLIAAHTNALSSELLHTGFRNAKNPLAALSPVTVSSVNALDGDVIVIETGVRKTEAAATSRLYRSRFSLNAGASDLPEDETTTTGGIGWVEFTQNLVFADMPPRLGSRALMGMGV